MEEPVNEGFMTPKFRPAAVPQTKSSHNSKLKKAHEKVDGSQNLSTK